MSLLATAIFVLPLAHRGPESYQSRAPSHERAVLAASGPLPGPTPQSIWHTDSGGNGAHLQSTLACAKTIGEFERTELHSFDGFGLDVGCNYNRPGGGTITIYLTRRHGQAISEDFTGADAAIKQRWSDVKPISGAVPAPSGLTFQSVLYARADGDRTGLWVADVAGWTYSIRATYAPDLEAKVMSTMATLTDAMRSSAGTHLAACAAAPAATRNGKMVTDQSRIMMLSLMSGALDAVMRDKAPDVKIAEDWCAEETAGDNEAPLLFWRNIAAGGGTNAGPMDRITVMTIEEPPTLVSIANPTASLADKEASGGADALIHQLSEFRGDTTYIFAFFAGRPGAAVLAPVAKNVFLGRQNPVTSFNAKSNTITIPSGDTKPGT